MTKRLLLLVFAALAAAIVAAGCGSDDEQATTTTSKASRGASELRATLTAALQEHVYLAGIAITQGVGEGLDSKPFKAAAATLDGNSKALAGAIGGVYGSEAGDQFLALWRDHIGFFVDYTAAKAGGDDAKAAKARKDLDAYRAEFGAFLASANPNLTAEAVAEELVPHVDSVFATIDSVVAGRADVFDKLAEAASHMPHTAQVLADAIAKQMPEKFASATVQIRAFIFSPKPLSVPAGTRVRFENLDATTHTVTSEGFRGELAPSTGRFEHTFARAGRYGYACELHSGPGMRGEVVVVA